MQKEDFLKAIESLYQRHRKRFNQDEAMIYFQKCSHMPLEAFNDIVWDLIEESRYFPTPGQIKREYSRWLAEHPEKSKQRDIYPCKYCRGNGWLSFSAYFEPLDRTYCHICRCGHCSNWYENRIPMCHPKWTVEDIEARGYTWLVAGAPGRDQYDMRFGKSTNDKAIPTEQSEQDAYERKQELKRQVGQL